MLCGGHRTLLSSPSHASTRPTSASSDSNKVVPYPEYVRMKYPKPGYRKPIVSVHSFDLEGYLAAQESEEEWHTLEKVERQDAAPVPTSHVVTLSWEGQRLAK